MNLSLAAKERLSGVDSEVDLLIGAKSSGLELLTSGFYSAELHPPFISPRIGQTIRENLPRVTVTSVCQFAHVKKRFPVLAAGRGWLAHPARGTRVSAMRGRWCFDGDEAVVGAVAARALGLKIGDSVQAKALPFQKDAPPIWGKELTVVGIFDSESPSTASQILVSPAHAWEYRQRAIEAGERIPFSHAPGVTHFLLFVDPEHPEDADEAFRMVHEGGAEQIIRVRQELESLAYLTGLGEAAAAWISIFFVAIAAAVTAVLFMERFEALKPELGLLRALGYSRRSVAWTILTEGGLIGLLGLAAGAVFQGALLAAAAPWFRSPWIQSIGFAQSPIGLLAAGTAGACLLAVALSLVRLYRWDPHDALRGM